MGAARRVERPDKSNVCTLVRTMETPRERSHLSLQADRASFGPAVCNRRRGPANYSRNFSRVRGESNIRIYRYLVIEGGRRRDGGGSGAETSIIAGGSVIPISIGQSFDAVVRDQHRGSAHYSRNFSRIEKATYVSKNVVTSLSEERRIGDSAASVGSDLNSALIERVKRKKSGMRV